ncbi:MAG: (2Fe-2S) ferredoxin domain-containing protein [Candidatus Krumholzibacteriia bacterium]
MDLIVCVGDHCHLNGSEMVVRSFQDLLKDHGLDDRVMLKGSFCLGKCSARDEVAIRLDGTVFHTRYQDAVACFRREIMPAIEAQLTDA